MTTTSIEALFAYMRASNLVVAQTRRLLVGLDAQDVKVVRDAVDELRGLLAAHGRARAEALGAIKPQEVES